MRTLTITSNPDWKAALRVAAQKAENGLRSGAYQGETLNFETPGAFFQGSLNADGALFPNCSGAEQ